jgi:hypothetical protein
VLFWDPETRFEYARRNHGQQPLIDLNDVFFAFHALILTLCTLAQFAIYDISASSPDRTQHYRFLRFLIRRYSQIFIGVSGMVAFGWALVGTVYSVQRVTWEWLPLVVLHEYFNQF